MSTLGSNFNCCSALGKNLSVNRPIVRSIRENIWTAVLMYGPNDVSSVRKTKVRIFSCMDRINWSIRTLLYSHNQRPKPSLNSELNIFLSTLNAAVGREIFKFIYLA